MEYGIFEYKEKQFKVLDRESLSDEEANVGADVLESLIAYERYSPPDFKWLKDNPIMIACMKHEELQEFTKDYFPEEQQETVSMVNCSSEYPGIIFSDKLKRLSLAEKIVHISQSIATCRMQLRGEEPTKEEGKRYARDIIKFIEPYITEEPDRKKWLEGEE